MQKKAFTLVELIVVITILAVLATVAFISFQGYAVSSRDSARLADINSITKILELYKVKNSKYPSPDSGTNIIYSGSVAWTQGVFGTSSYTDSSSMSNVPVDPVTGLEYAYSRTVTGQEYQLGAVLEQPVSSKLANNTFAGTQEAEVYVKGNYNGKFLKVSANSTTYLLGVPSILASDITSIDLVQILNNQKLVYNGFKNLPASFSGSVYNTNPTNGFNFTPAQLILFEGNTQDLVNNQSDRVIFLSSLQTNYTSSPIVSETSIAEVLAIDSTSATTSSNYVATVLNNSLKTNIPVIAVSTNTSVSECYNPVNIGTVGLASWTECAGLLIVENGSGVNGIVTAVTTGITVGTIIYGTTNIFTGQVTDMTGLFYNAKTFNDNIGYWDMSNVTNVSGMFYSAEGFNQNIGGWNMSKVTDMSYMFSRSYVFNQDITGWDISNVTNVSGMFFRAYAFNQNIGGWNTSKITNMSYMFSRTYDGFNQDIGGWDVSNVTNMSGIFHGAEGFNQDISGWDVSNVTDMNYMFSQTYVFNQDISGWNTSKVTDMSSMFIYAYIFNQDISGWDVSSVTNMDYMFKETNDFNKDISTWCVSNIASKPLDFDLNSSVLFLNNTAIQPQWGTCP